MKKSNLLLLSLLALPLAACEVESTDQAADTAGSGEASEGPIHIVATTSHAKDVLEQVGGDLVDVDGLMGAGVDPHEYEPTASDVEAINNAEAVVYNGLHLEAMFDSVFQELEASGTPTMVMSDALDDDDILQGEEDGMEYDPHIWFSVDNWSKIADETAKFLAELDPENAEVYQENVENYQTEIAELDDYIESKIETIPEGSRYLVTAHDAFQYFADDYDFEVVGIQGLNTQTEAGTRDISDLANFIAENNINAVFVESSVSSRNMEALIEAVEAQGHDIELGGELYSDALGSAEQGTDTYIEMYKSNIDTIASGLGE